MGSPRFEGSANIAFEGTATNIKMDGTQAVGSLTTVPRADHVHPTDTSRAPLASPTFTGTPAAPTATADTNTTQLATTAFVVGQAGTLTPAKSTMNGAVGTSKKYSREDHIHPTVRAFNSLTCSQDSERRFFKDDFSNNTIGQYTGDISSFVYNTGSKCLEITSSAIKYAEKSLYGGYYKFRWVSSFSGVGASTTAERRFYFGTSIQEAYFRIYQHSSSNTTIYYNLAVGTYASGGYTFVVADAATWSNTRRIVSIVINSSTSISVYLDDVLLRTFTSSVELVSENTALRFYSNGWGTYSSTCQLYEVAAFPSVAHTDPFTSDTEARYMQLSSANITLPSPTGTWAAAIAGDVVVSGGKMTLASTASTYQEALCSVLRSYNFGSGEYEFAFDNNNDGGGGADSCGLVFGYQDILNHYKLVLNDDTAGAETLKLYKVVAGTATQLGSTADVSSTYTRGNKTWLKLHWDAIKGRMWVYLRDDAGTYPTTPNISDAFSAQFAYGKAGFWAAVTTAGAGNLSVDFYPITIRALSLIGETNVPATETGFYFRDEFSVDDSGRWNGDTSLFTWDTANSKLTINDTLNARQIHLASPLPVNYISFKYSFSNITTVSNSLYVLFGDSSPTLSGTPLAGTRYALSIRKQGSCVIREYVNGSLQWSTELTNYKTTVAGTEYICTITWSASSIVVTFADADGSNVLTNTKTLTGTDIQISPGQRIGFGTHNDQLNAYWSVKELVISGTRYYNQPMLRGAQQGQYWNGTAAVTCTRFVDDFNWDTSGEYTLTSATINTLGGVDCTYIASGNNIENKIATYTYGVYKYLLKRTHASTTGYYFKCGIGAVAWAGSNSTFYANGNASISGTFGIANGDIVEIEIYVHSAGYTINANNLTTGVRSQHITTTAPTNPGGNKLGLQVYAGSGTTATLLHMSANCIDSSAGNNPTCLGGVPHGARYDTPEYAVRSFTNAVRYGEYRLASAIKTTNASAEDIELYLKNATDSSNITDDASDTVAVALSDTNWANVTKAAYLNADDVSDTITIQARRKTAATDNTPACLVDFVELLPIVEVG